MNLSSFSRGFLAIATLMAGTANATLYPSSQPEPYPFAYVMNFRLPGHAPISMTGFGGAIVTDFYVNHFIRSNSAVDDGTGTVWAYTVDSQAIDETDPMNPITRATATGSLLVKIDGQHVLGATGNNGNIDNPTGTFNLNWISLNLFGAGFSAEALSPLPSGQVSIIPYLGDYASTPSTIDFNSKYTVGGTDYPLQTMTDVNGSSIPEPATLSLLVLGLLGIRQGRSRAGRAHAFHARQFNVQA